MSVASDGGGDRNGTGRMAHTSPHIKSADLNITGEVLISVSAMHEGRNHAVLISISFVKIAAGDVVSYALRDDNTAKCTAFMI